MLGPDWGLEYAPSGVVPGWKERTECQSIARVDGREGCETGEGEGERSREGVRVTSRIDFAVVGEGAELGPLETEWELSDHSAIGGVVQVDATEGAVDEREVVYWDAVTRTVADEGEGWDGCLVGGSAYEKLMDFRR